MNRRDFIIKGLKLGGALLTGANISTFLNSIANQIEKRWQKIY